MKSKKWSYNLLVLALLQLVVALPSIAGDYNVSDISLSPGSDASKLNLNWQTADTATTSCAVKIAEGGRFSKKSNIFIGTKTLNPSTNEYYCEVTVTDLKYSKNYSYRLGNNNGSWSDSYNYSTGNKNNYGFFYVADSQIGASAKMCPPPDVDPTCSVTENDRILADDNDAAGWAETVDIMTDIFPHGAFIMSGGDQIENKGREYEYTGFFSPAELTSLPVAPTVGSHDREINHNYHFNLPNESSQYGYYSKGGGDYYFTYGNALFMVLNMDKTTRTYQRGQPGDDDSDGVSNSIDQCPYTSKGAVVDSATGCQVGELPTDTDGDEVPDYKDQCPCSDGEGSETGCIEGEEPSSDCKAINDCKPLSSFNVSDHKAFMEDAIAKNPGVEWKIVMWHYSIYSAGNHAADDDIQALRDAIVPVIDSLDIDLVLMAHDHVYTRTYQMLNDVPQEAPKKVKYAANVNPPGTLYVTGATSSGSKYYSLNCAYPGDDYFEYAAKADDVGSPSFSYIDVRNNMLRITTFAYTITDEETGKYDLEVIDTYKIVKNEPRPLPKER